VPWSWAHARKVEVEEELDVWACKTRVKDRWEMDAYGRGSVARRHLQAAGLPT